MSAYLLINLCTVVGPLILSFERRVHYVSRWKHVLAAAFLSALVFVPWDMAFTRLGVWGFTEAYLWGVRVGPLPLEEVLFFFTVPFSCLFIYELLGLAPLRRHSGRRVRVMSGAVILCAGVVALFNRDHRYTMVVFSAVAVFLSLVVFVMKPRYLQRFLGAYLLTLIPFVLVNGILTRGIRAIAPEPVVWYNAADIIGIRIGTVPLEDFAYWFLLYLLNVIVYETLKKYVR